jgi:hypothetical protein
MTTRTFKQFGHAYHSTPAEITVKIAGQQIFSGTVDTSTLPPPEKLTDEDGLGTVMFTWTEDTEFSGTRDLEVTVNRGYVIFTSTQADHSIAEAPEEFSHFYTETHDSIEYTECMSNVVVNGTALPRTWDDVNIGQYHCHVAEAGIYTATINIMAAPAAV